MSFEIQTVDFNELPAGLDQLFLATQEPDVQMIPLTTERATRQHRVGWAALNQEGIAVGYIAVTFEYGEGAIHEIGGLVVDPEQRGKGLGQALVDYATNEVSKTGAHPIAFCNPLSIRLFKKAGFIPAEGGAPVEAYEFCGDCRKQPECGGCCDQVLTFNEESTVAIRGHL
jgi:N-acetylglutamate synthase-like GNAT family acetyltransferase